MDIKIPLDNSLFLIKNDRNRELKFYSQVDECLGNFYIDFWYWFNYCSLNLTKIILPNKSTNIFLSTRYRQIIQIKDEHYNRFCDFDYTSYQDQAVYRIDLLFKNSTQLINDCRIEKITKGRDNWWPLIILIAIILSFSSFNLVRNIFTRYISKRRSSDLIENLNRLDSTIKHATDLNNNSSQSKRSQSVDVFRGIIIMMMIFVNYGAGGYVFLEHKPWFGLSVADIIFPGFLFLMGTSIGFSLKSIVSKDENINTKKICTKIIKRSFILFLFGLIMNSIGENDLSRLRIPGVLQRFAICYLIMALLHLYSIINSKNNTMHKFLNFFYKFYLADIYPFYLEWLFMILMTGIYIYFTLFFNYDKKCDVGYQGPGGFHQNSTHFNCTGGAARAIDVWVFGKEHMYQHSTAKSVYGNTQNHDPEGLLGTIGSLLVVFFGLQIAKIQISFTEPKMKFTRFTFHFATLGVLALILHFTGSIPICKNLWSLSFVFITTSICYLIFIILYFIIEIKNYWNGDPFNYAGKNALFLYLGHEIFSNMFPFYYFVDESSHYLLLMRCSIATFIWLLISIYFGRKKIFIKI